MRENSRSSVLNKRPQWSVRLPVDGHYADLRHVGNLEFSRLFQDARSAFTRYLTANLRAEEHFNEQLIVHIDMDFHSEVLWTTELEIFVRTARVGMTSYEVELTVWHDAEIAVRCKTVSVCMKAGMPVPITDQARTLLMAHT